MGVWVCVGVTCVICCDSFGLELTYLLKGTSENRYCIHMARDLCMGWPHLKTQRCFYLAHRDMSLFKGRARIESTVCHLAGENKKLGGKKKTFTRPFGSQKKIQQAVTSWFTEFK